MGLATAWRRFLQRAFAPSPAGWERTPEHERAAALLFVLLFVLLFTRLGERVLPAFDDITHAAIGRGILQTGDWFTMHYNGRPTWLKPPLYFWLEAAAFRLFSPSGYWARFPAALCGLGTLLLSYAIAARALGRRAAFWSVISLATTFFFLKYARRAMLDVPVAFATTLGVWALARGEEKPRADLWLGPSLALGYYFKAAQGLYILPIAALYLAATRQWRRLFGPWVLGGFFLGAALIAAWVAPQLRVYGRAFVDTQCGLLPILHRGVYDSRHIPFYVPLKTLLQIDWPWIPVSLWGLWALSARPGEGQDRAAWLLALWAGVILAELMVVNTFFQRYLVPMAPPLALAAGAALDRWISPERFRSAARAAIAVVAVGVVAVTCLPIPLDSLHGMDHYQALLVVDDVVPKTAPLFLYKGEIDPWEQGLSFYSDRYLDGQALTPGELLADRDRVAGPAFAAASQSDFAGLEAVAQGKERFRVAARAGNFVLFEILPGR